ncbi:MAG: hypothetical protein GC181_05010 [Bacteroidetes bacterium]|nr:hypothetical protein [Bacteroidota bacterium]
MNITLTTFFLAILGFLVIRFATRIALKLLGWALLISLGIFLLFYFGIGPFHENPVSINTLKEHYCEPNQDSLKNKCDCIVRIVEKDIHKRWSDAELEELSDNRTEMGYIFTRSFEASQDQIKECLEKRNAGNELQEFKRDLIPVKNEWLKKLDDWKERIQQKSEQAVDSFINRKHEIDRRYE